MIKKITIEVDVGTPIEVAPGTGVFETKLSHPLLKGSLAYVHHDIAAGEQLLKSLDSSIVGEITKVIGFLGDLENGTPKAKNGTKGGVKEKSVSEVS